MPPFDLGLAHGLEGLVHADKRVRTVKVRFPSICSGMRVSDEGGTRKVVRFRDAPSEDILRFSTEQ
jgi:CTP synthase (UTP-ammonia lyase)